MRQVIVGIFFFCLFSSISYAQTGDTIYYRFSKCEKNQVLFDVENHYGFAFAISEMLRNGSKFSFEEFTVSGIKEQDQKKLLGGSPGKTLDDLGFKEYSGPQARTPLANIWGEDSVTYLPDGTTSYIYPQRKIVWTDLSSYDEIVVQAIRTISDKNTIVAVPVKIYLLKKYANLPKPIILLSFEWKHLFVHPIEWWSEINETVANNLLDQLEFYQQQELKQKDTETFYIYPYNLIFKITSLQLNKNDVTWDAICSSWMTQPFKEANVVFHTLIREVHTNLLNIYGEDSTVYSENGTMLPIYRVHFDTLIACQGPFYKLYEKHWLQYELDGVWSEAISDGCATVKGNTGEELVYFIATYSKIVMHREGRINPISIWVKQQKKIKLDQLPWEQLLDNPDLLKEKVYKP